jgi:hypothetical protein
MCRTADAGGYSVGNVRIDTPMANAVERGQVQTRRLYADAWGQSTAGNSWLDIDAKRWGRQDESEEDEDL